MTLRVVWTEWVCIGLVASGGGGGGVSRSHREVRVAKNGRTRNLHMEVPPQCWYFQALGSLSSPVMFLGYNFNIPCVITV